MSDAFIKLYAAAGFLFCTAAMKIAGMTWKAAITAGAVVGIVAFVFFEPVAAWLIS